MAFKDFCQHPSSRKAGLNAAHVLALRLYSTAAFKSINYPLRDQSRVKRNERHKLAMTVFFVYKAVVRLRRVEENDVNANTEVRVVLVPQCCCSTSL